MFACKDSAAVVYLVFFKDMTCIFIIIIIIKLSELFIHIGSSLVSSRIQFHEYHWMFP